MKLVQTIGCPRIKNMDVECEVKPAVWNWYRLWCQTLMWIQPRQLVSLRIKTRFYEGNVCEVKRNFAVWWRYPRWFGCREMWVAVSHLCTNTNYHYLLRHASCQNVVTITGSKSIYLSDRTSVCLFVLLYCNDCSVHYTTHFR